MWQHIMNVSLFTIMAAWMAFGFVESLNKLKNSFGRILVAVGTYGGSVAIYFFINGTRRVSGAWRDLFMFFLGTSLITTFVLFWSALVPALGSKKQTEKNIKSAKHRCLLSRRPLLKRKRHSLLLR